jgi:outer membrane receptor for ferrienterochelin and colicin
VKVSERVVLVTRIETVTTTIRVRGYDPETALRLVKTYGGVPVDEKNEVRYELREGER